MFAKYSHNMMSAVFILNGNGDVKRHPLIVMYYNISDYYIFPLRNNTLN